MNDQQWTQMQAYYKHSVQSGVYIAPRGVRDTWNTHFNDESYACYDRSDLTLLMSPMDAMTGQT